MTTVLVTIEQARGLFLNMILRAYCVGQPYSFL